MIVFCLIYTDFLIDISGFTRDTNISIDIAQGSYL